MMSKTIVTGVVLATLTAGFCYHLSASSIVEGSAIAPQASMAGTPAKAVMQQNRQSAVLRPGAKVHHHSAICGCGHEHAQVEREAFYSAEQVAALNERLQEMSISAPVSSSIRLNDMFTLPPELGNYQSKVNLKRKQGRFTEVSGELTNVKGSFRIYIAEGGEFQAWIIDKEKSIQYVIKNGKAHVYKSCRRTEKVVPYSLSEVIKDGLATSIPKLNSKPGSAQVLYLDFDGEKSFILDGGKKVEIKAWGSAKQIRAIFNETVGMFAAFDVNVTTDIEVFNKSKKRARMIITTTDGASPRGVQGYAGLDAFGEIDNPGITMVDHSHDSLANVAETIVHEFGHTLRLEHQGDTEQGAYTGGFGKAIRGRSGREFRWAPIMGSPASDVFQWSNGTYENATSKQDDLKVIAEKLPRRVDDIVNAKVLLSATTAVIETAKDTDSFIIIADSDKLEIKAGHTGENYYMVLSAVLKDEAGKVMATAKGTSLKLAAAVKKGQKYTLTIDAVGDGQHITDYGAIGSYFVTTSVSGKPVEKPVGKPPVTTQPPTGGTDKPTTPEKPAEQPEEKPTEPEQPAEKPEDKPSELEQGEGDYGDYEDYDSYDDYEGYDDYDEGSAYEDVYGEDGTYAAESVGLLYVDGEFTLSRDPFFADGAYLGRLFLKERENTEAVYLMIHLETREQRLATRLDLDYLASVGYTAKGILGYAPTSIDENVAAVVDYGGFCEEDQQAMDALEALSPEQLINMTDEEFEDYVNVIADSQQNSLREQLLMSVDPQETLEDVLFLILK